MATLDQSKKEELADLMRRASTWVGGARSVALLAGSYEILGEEPADAQEKALADLTRSYDPRVTDEEAQERVAQSLDTRERSNLDHLSLAPPTTGEDEDNEDD